MHLSSVVEVVVVGVVIVGVPGSARGLTAAVSQEHVPGGG